MKVVFASSRQTEFMASWRGNRSECNMLKNGRNEPVIQIEWVVPYAIFYPQRYRVIKLTRYCVVYHSNTRMSSNFSPARWSYLASDKGSGRERETTLIHGQPCLHQGLLGCCIDAIAIARRLNLVLRFAPTARCSVQAG